MDTETQNPFGKMVKKTFYTMVKGSREDQNMVQSITRDPGHVPVPATGRCPGLQINASAAFPVSQ